MEILEKTRSLVERVEELKDRLLNVTIALERTKDVDKTEKLWAEEFNLILQLADARFRAEDAIKELKMKENMDFIADKFTRRVTSDT
jgi:pilus assembly protein TadC